MNPRGQNNFVSEWFGHRTFPQVASQPEARRDQKAERCPFLSHETGEDRRCVKQPNSRGVCTITTRKGSAFEDWLVCPYRVLDQRLLGRVASDLFDLQGPADPFVAPLPVLSTRPGRESFDEALTRGRPCIVFFQDKLGGEISVSKTDRSPEMAFDVTMVRIEQNGHEVQLGRYGIVEVQTMDFHGSYRHAVTDLRDALRLHGEDFASVLQQKPEWLAKGIEGPNIANVFKRTFYQIMLKFQIGAHPSCAGCALMLPTSVWTSWQRHLGQPALRDRGDGTYALEQPDRTSPSDRPSAWIYLLDIDRTAPATPAPMVIDKVIVTDADAIAHFALKVGAESAVAAAASSRRSIPFSIKTRLRLVWPELAARLAD